MKKRIVVIEDEVKLLSNISLILKAENYDVISISDGRRGIDLIKQTKPDLIICDIMMPGIDGYEVLKEIKKDKSTSDIPFIFLSSKAERSDLRKGMEMGADDYLMKPFRSDELLNAIEARLNRFELIKARVLENPGSGKKINEYKIGENIFFKLHNSSIITPVDMIKYIAARIQYSNVVLYDNRQVLIRRSIKKWESLLPESLFLRIHKSTIINIKFVNQIKKINNKHIVILKNTEDSFEISKRFFRKLSYKCNPGDLYEKSIAC